MEIDQVNHNADTKLRKGQAYRTKTAKHDPVDL
jgi:hypothetical protein